MALIARKMPPLFYVKFSIHRKWNDDSFRFLHKGTEITKNNEKNNILSFIATISMVT